MCGIFGAIELNGYFNGIDYNKFITLTDLVSYRGPDDSGYKALNMKDSVVNNENKFDIYLGHRRLSIIDLSDAGHQPLTDGDGLWIIYNGEIFNYIELKEVLRKKGYIFKTNTDTEVILKTYREYGEEGFAKFNGMWAFCIVDMRKRKIILSRDRFSIKPIYYTRIDSKIYFASEIKQILPLMQARVLNKNVMFKYLEQGLIDDNEETFFQHIYKLKEKHNMLIDLVSGRVEEHKYWDYSRGTERLRSNDAVEEFRELFIDSIRIRLRSDVKTGALLSGGLDSSSISVIANNFNNGEFQTYSIVSKEKKYSEEKYIDILRDKAKINVNKVYFEFENSAKLISDINEVIYHNDEPFGSFKVIAQYRILRALKDNSDITVVLSGQGGDEILMGYLKYYFFNIKNLIKEGNFLEALIHVISSLARRTTILQFNLSQARRYMPLFMRKAPKPFLKIKGKLEPVWVANNLRERQILDIDKYSVPALTHCEDRNSMAHSLEIRHPFLDHRLVDFALNLPTALKLNGGWTKYILRKSAYELPDAIRWRKDKQGFIIPEELWLKKDLSSLINVIFRKSVLDDMGIIDSNLFLRYYRSFQDGNKLIWHTDISKMLIAELWARKYLYDYDREV